MAMDRGHITRTVHTARTADPGWDGRHLRGVRIRLWLAVGLLVIGPLSVVAGLVAVSAVFAGEWVMPLVLQLGIAVAGGLLALGLAGPLGWYLARGAAGQGDASTSVMVVGWVRLLVVLGLVCPPAVIGLGFSNIAVVPTLVGLPMLPAWLMAVVIATAVALPIATLVMETAWRGVEVTDERIAAALGWQVTAIYGLLVQPRLAPALRPALGLAIARVLGEWSAFYFLVANDQGAPLGAFALSAVGPHVTNTGVMRGSSAILLVLTIALVMACKGALYGLIPQVSHRISTHYYRPDAFDLEPEVEDEGNDGAVSPAEDAEGSTPEDVAAFFADINGPGLAYAAHLSEEETAYLHAHESRADTAPEDPIWAGAPGMPKAWEAPGLYWPQAEDAEPISAPESPDGTGDDATVLGEKTASPFLRIRTRSREDEV